LLITPQNGFTSAGGVGGPFTVTSQTLTLTNTGTNTLSWSLVSTSAWLTASPSGGSLSPRGTATTVTASLTSAANNLGLGTYSATVWFTNLNDKFGQSRVFTLSIITPPTITTQPTNQTVLEGEAAAFNGTAIGGQPLAYQWLNNGTVLTNSSTISGATTTNVTFGSVVAGEAGTITLIVTNAAGSATSTPALLIIPLSQPVFTLEPTNETFYQTQTAEFAVAVVGTEPYSYQWTFNGQNLAGATNATLILSKLQLTQAGNYAVVATNSQGSTTSATAVLTVNPLPPCAPVDEGMVSWWAGEGNAEDSLGLNNGTLVGGVTFVPGVVGQAFYFDGTSGYASIPDSPSLDALTGSFTVECWIKVTQFSSQDWISIVCKGDNSWQLRRYGTGSTLSFWTDGLSNPELEGNRNIDDGQWHHVAGVYDLTNKYIYVDGTLDVSEPATGSIAVSTYPLLIGNNPESLQRLFNGAVDELSVYGRALSAAEIQLIYLAGIGGKCPVPLAITTQPTNQFANTGESVTFAVVAAGPQPLSYQWNFNGTNISGATNTLLTLSDVTTNNNGVYAVTVANPSGSITSSNAVLAVLPPSPTIVTQPANQTNFAGTTATFSVTVAGLAPFSYQWTFNGTILAGTTNATLTLMNVQPSQSGNYAVTVTNLFGSATSSNAYLTILTQPPTILTQPVGQTNYVYESANFSVTAAGSPPLSYQWSFNTTNLAGATNANLTLNYLQLAQAGNYSVQVSNPYGSTNSIPAVLVVNPAPPCAPVLNGMVDWWPGEGNANDLIGTNNGTLAGGVTFAPGEVGQAFVFDGSDYVSIPDALSIDALTNAMTVEAWIKVTQFSSQDWISIICKGDTSWQLRRYSTSSTLSFWTDGLSNPELEGNRNINDGQWHHVAGVYDGTNKYIYVDGTLDVSEPATGTIAVNTQPLLLGDNAGALQRNFDGLVDEVSIYNRALSAQEIQTIYVAGSNGKCPPVPTPPGITTQPTNETVSADSTASFTVAANGTLPLSYQWSFDGTNLAGATQPNLTLTNVQPSQSGNYTVIITNLYGSATSSPAFLTVVTLPPTILTQPQSETNLTGTTATFSVAANGTTPLSYQWSLNATNLTGATNATLTLINVQTNEAGNYLVTVANAYGSTNSANAVLTVIPAPSCDPAPSGLVNWWQGQNNANDSVGTNNGSLSGAVTYAAGEVGQAFVLNGSDYVSIPDSPSIDALTNAITIEAWIKVTQFSSQDWISIVCKGDTSWQLRRYGATSTLSFWTDGLSNPELQGSRNINDGKWHHVAGVYNGTTKYLYVDGTLDVSEPATGTIAVNTQPLLLGNNAGALQRNFNGLVDEVSLYNRALSASEIQAIYATGSGGKCPLPILISSQPTNQTATPGHTITLSVAATGMRPLLYQWNFYGTNLPAATNSSLVLTNVQLANSGIYSVTIANPYESLTSTNALLTVATLPVIITQPASMTNLTGTTATFNVTAIGTPPLAYQWLYNTTNLPGATNPSLSLTNLVLGQAGTYAVLVTNQYGSTISSNALLEVNPSLHFVWNLVPSPRFVNTPFSVVVQAQTPTNGVATNFTSTVTLGSTNGIAIAPTASGNFIQGVWTGVVTVPQTATNLVLQATDTLGDYGLANPVNIVNLPSLTTVASSGTLLILWPLTPAGFVLESTSDLTQTNWLPVTTPPFQIGNQNLLPISTSGTNAFYRLRFPGP